MSGTARRLRRTTTSTSNTGNTGNTENAGNAGNAGNTTTDRTARQALDQGLALWNGDADLARRTCADDVRLHFAVTEPDGSTPADEIRSAEDFARYLQWWHVQHPALLEADQARWATRPLG